MFLSIPKKYKCNISETYWSWQKTNEIIELFKTASTHKEIELRKNFFSEPKFCNISLSRIWKHVFESIFVSFISRHAFEMVFRSNKSNHLVLFLKMEVFLFLPSSLPVPSYPVFIPECFCEWQKAIISSTSPSTIRRGVFMNYGVSTSTIVGQLLFDIYPKSIKCKAN